VVFSCITLAASVLLPLLVDQPENSRKANQEEEQQHQVSSRMWQLWKRTRIPSIAMFLRDKTRPFRPRLTMTWAIGHAVFAFAMFCAPFVHSVSGATFVVGLCGLPWALVCWAPFALLGDEIAKMGRAEDGYEMVETEIEHRSPPPSYEQIEKSAQSEEMEGAGDSGHPESSNACRDSLDSVLSDIHDEDLEVLNEDLTQDEEEQERILRIARRSEGRGRSLSAHIREPAPTNDIAGEMLGIMNVFVTLPQFIMTFVSSVVFAILEPGKSKELTEGKVEERGAVSAIAVVMVIGGIGSIAAGWLTIKLRRLG